MLIAIEGIDGVGKSTLIKVLCRLFKSKNTSISCINFPCSKKSIFADLAVEALYGKHGDLSKSIYAMAVLFAFDRANMRKKIIKLRSINNIVILDRYVASNIAYNLARTQQKFISKVLNWVYKLEFKRFKLPKPDLQIFFDAKTKLAVQKTKFRSTGKLSLSRRDIYECNYELQYRVRRIYKSLAYSNWCSKWMVASLNTNPIILAELLMK